MTTDRLIDILNAAFDMGRKCINPDTVVVGYDSDTMDDFPIQSVTYDTAVRDDYEVEEGQLEWVVDGHPRGYFDGDGNDDDFTFNGYRHEYKAKLIHLECLTKKEMNELVTLLNGLGSGEWMVLLDMVTKTVPLQSAQHPMKEFLA